MYSFFDVFKLRKSSFCYQFLPGLLFLVVRLSMKFKILSSNFLSWQLLTVSRVGVAVVFAVVVFSEIAFW